MAIADKAGGCYREDRNLTPFSLQPRFFGRRQGTLDSSQGVKAGEPRLTGVEGLRHTLALWAEAWGGLSWFELLQPDFLELSWKEALLGEAENWSPRVFWIGHIYCTYYVKRKGGQSPLLRGKKFTWWYEFQIVQGERKPPPPATLMQRNRVEGTDRWRFAMGRLSHA